MKKEAVLRRHRSSTTITTITTMVATQETITIKTIIIRDKKLVIIATVQGNVPVVLGEERKGTSTTGVCMTVMNATEVADVQLAAAADGW